jgi:hypothetical protein
MGIGFHPSFAFADHCTRRIEEEERQREEEERAKEEAKLRKKEKEKACVPFAVS